MTKDEFFQQWNAAKTDDEKYDLFYKVARTGYKDLVIEIFRATQNELLDIFTRRKTKETLKNASD